MKKALKVLAVDIGGTNVKNLATGQTEPCKFPSGKTLTPRKMVRGVKQLAKDWQYDVVAIGYHGKVVADRATTEPRNLAHGWVGFDFAAAFGRPVKSPDDAAMQALGSYEGGTMLFLGLGTGLGAALMVRGHIVPMELGALSYRKGAMEDHLGARELKKAGKKKWRKTVEFAVKRLTSALLLGDVVIGGGNAKKLKQVPPGCRLDSNANAFLGGYRMWELWTTRAPQAFQGPRVDQAKKAKGSRR
jgi:predicted NBD/HSP70 family sugar kinase